MKKEPTPYTLELIEAKLARIEQRGQERGPFKYKRILQQATYLDNLKKRKLLPPEGSELRRKVRDRMTSVRGVHVDLKDIIDSPTERQAE